MDFYCEWPVLIWDHFHLSYFEFDFVSVNIFYPDMGDDLGEINIFNYQPGTPEYKQLQVIVAGGSWAMNSRGKIILLNPPPKVIIPEWWEIHYMYITDTVTVFTVALFCFMIFCLISIVVSLYDYNKRKAPKDFIEFEKIIFQASFMCRGYLLTRPRDNFILRQYYKCKEKPTLFLNKGLLVVFNKLFEIVLAFVWLRDTLYKKAMYFYSKITYFRIFCFVMCLVFIKFFFF